MNKTAKTGLLIVIFVLGLIVGILLDQDEITAPGAGKLVKKEVATSDLSIPDLVAKQIKSGNLTCPDGDPLTYETCLLFQGALGIWRNDLMADQCSPIVSENYKYNMSDKVPDLQTGYEDAIRAPNAPCFGYIYSAMVANVTPILISTANNVFKEEASPNFTNPGSDPKLCLLSRYGICGNQAAFGVALLKRAGFKARPVEFYYVSDLGHRSSHIIVEVFIDGKWRLIDTTYGAFWIDNKVGSPFKLLALEEIINGQSIKKMLNLALIPYAMYKETSRYDFFQYLNPLASIIRGGKGEVSLSLANSSKGLERFDNLPNYIGDNNSDSIFEGISYKFLEVPHGRYFMRVKVSASAISGSGQVEICIDRLCHPYSKDENVYEFLVNNPQKLYLKTSMDVAYLVLDSIKWEILAN